MQQYVLTIKNTKIGQREKLMHRCFKHLYWSVGGDSTGFED